MTAPKESYLYGPYIDFALLGGGSILALVAILAFSGGDVSARAWSLGTTLALANFVNHPHFAHSYQIFYSNFRQKLSSGSYPRALRIRYALIGLFAPAIMMGLLVWMVVEKHPRALGLGANAMFFLVGWHYVKQGFGMAMLDAALKRAFFSAGEKHLLLANAYIAWIFSWLLINYLLIEQNVTYWEIEYFVVSIPLWLLTLVGVASFASAAVLSLALRRRYRRGSPVPWNGLLAYSVSIYAWLLVRDPIALLWIPFFHSLQYMAVVYKFQANRLRSRKLPSREAHLRLVLFFVIGTGVGYAVFWVLPDWLNRNIRYDRTLFGSALFFYLSWIFINVHHYLLDAVMWRKGNPDVAQHLFGASPAR